MANWTEMTSEEKIEVLTSLLEKAAINLPFRDRLLQDPVSALDAWREFNEQTGAEIDFPADFKITFISTHDAETTTDSVLMRVPDYFPNGEAPPIDLEEHLFCTYNYWKDIRARTRRNKRPKA